MTIKKILIFICFPFIGFAQCDRQQIVDNYNNIYLESEVSTLQLGYKSTGYAIGEQLNKGLIIRGGLTFKLSK